MTPEQYMDAVKRLDGYYHIKVGAQFAQFQNELHDMHIEIMHLSEGMKENRKLMRKVCRRLKIKMNEKDEED